MPATTRDAVIAMAPELEAIPDGARWTLAIADADLELGTNAADRYGAHHERAARLLVAHKLTISARKGGSQVQSESIGGIVSRSYAVAAPSSDADPLSSTAYGAELKALRRALFSGPMVL